MELSITEALIQAIGRGLAQGFVGETPAQPPARRARRTRRSAGPRSARRKRKATKATRRARKAAKRGARRATKKVARGPRGGVKSGDYVTYRQGRGTFVAKVGAVDKDAGTATVRRVTDGKRVERPLSKLRRAKAP